jgi:hypothetical protein
MLRKNQKGSPYQHKLPSTRRKQIGICSPHFLAGLNRVAQCNTLMGKEVNHQGRTEPPGKGGKVQEKTMKKSKPFKYIEPDYSDRLR